MAAAQTEVKAVVTPIAPAEKQEPQQPVAKAGQQHQAALAVVLRAAKRFNVEARFESLRRYYEKVRSFVWYWIEELLEVGVKWFELQGGHNVTRLLARPLKLLTRSACPIRECVNAVAFEGCACQGR